MCTSYTCKVYMYTITTVHLDFFRALQVSCPDTWAQIQIPRMQFVSICILKLETSANHRSAGNPPLPCLFYGWNGVQHTSEKH